MPDAGLDWLIRHTLGNPLGVLTFADTAASATDADRDSAEPAAGKLGSRIVRAFSQRWSGLPPPALTAAIIASASLTGDLGTVTTAVDLAGMSARELEACETSGLLDLSGPALHFYHPLARHTVYSSATPDERRSAHRWLAAALIGRTEPAAADERAWHLAAAAEGPETEAADALIEVSHRARQRGDLRAAAAAARRAAGLTADITIRCERLLAAGEASLLAGDQAEVDALVAAVLDTADDAGLRARAAALQTQVQLLRSSPVQVHDMLVAAADEVHSADPAQAALLLATAAAAAAMGGEVAASIGTAERAVAAAGPSIAARSVAGAALAHGLVLTGSGQRAGALIDEALPELAAHDPLAFGSEVYGFLGLDLVYLERWDEARQLLRRGIAAARKAAAPERLVNLLAVLAELDLRTGRWDAALTAATESADQAENIGQPIGEAYAHALLARLAAWRGDEPAGNSHLLRADNLLRDLDAALVMPYVSYAGALLAETRSEWDRASAELSGLAAAMRSAGAGNPAILQLQADLLESCVRSGRPGGVSDIVDDLEQTAARSPSMWTTAVTQLARATMAPHDSARWAAARAAASEVADPFLRGRIDLLHGEALLRSGHTEQAAELLPVALAAFASLRARPWSNRAAEELRRCGGRSPAPVSRPAVTLTPQETQVAYHVMNGATNQETAAILFVSVKTVEAHLGHIYTKLGVRSRTQMAHRLRESLSL